jgi:hypothetical protein
MKVRNRFVIQTAIIKIRIRFILLTFSIFQVFPQPHSQGRQRVRHLPHLAHLHGKNNYVIVNCFNF